MEVIPYRILKIHAAAHFKERFMPFLVLGQSLGLMKGDGGGAQIAHVSRSGGGGGKTGASATSLYSWFKRRPGRVYNVVSSEAPLSQLRGVAAEWASGGKAL